MRNGDGIGTPLLVLLLIAAVNSRLVYRMCYLEGAENLGGRKPWAKNVAEAGKPHHSQ